MSAAFDKQRLETIYGHAPSCSLCGKLASEAHHVLGRYYGLKRRKWGVGVSHKDAGIMSSVLNCSMLCRDCHNRGDIHTKDVRLKLLDKAKACVDMAVIERKIELNENDSVFLTRIIPNHFPPKK